MVNIHAALFILLNILLLLLVQNDGRRVCYGILNLFVIKFVTLISNK